MARTDLSDPDKTRKLPTIRRRLTVEEIVAREKEKIQRFEDQAEISRERLRALGIAA